MAEKYKHRVSWSYPTDLRYIYQHVIRANTEAISRDPPGPAQYIGTSAELAPLPYTAEEIGEAAKAALLDVDDAHFHLAAVATRDCLPLDVFRSLGEYMAVYRSQELYDGYVR